MFTARMLWVYDVGSTVTIDLQLFTSNQKRSKVKHEEKHNIKYAFLEYIRAIQKLFVNNFPGVISILTANCINQFFEKKKLTVVAKYDVH